MVGTEKLIHEQEEWNYTATTTQCSGSIRQTKSGANLTPKDLGSSKLDEREGY
ncbi:hypothetical protein M378DRAFT_161869 [Amanita muscaria Koide BX008]|uniref:Uncharacterized protein n=1 Tax=Amanita muscaria (strain Koide BX008) TaxID=946122 RepID=A0A0C2SQK9_AMAMK|nr:hypothetical protein M378DRAFT_161869 [Amanita muscaria Koide BX008]